jgi:hypothetical protein
MFVAIISDIHNNEVNLKKVLNYCEGNKISTIICCGDLASEETLEFLNNNFSGQIHYTFGNMDNDQLLGHLISNWTSNVLKYKNTILYKKFGETEMDHKKIAFVHFPEIAKRLCETGKYDFVFYGHTHKPWVSSAKASADQGKKKCIMLNPGNVAGDIYPPTFAIWDTRNDSFKLIRVHDLKPSS